MVRTLFWESERPNSKSCLGLNLSKDLKQHIIAWRGYRSLSHSLSLLLEPFFFFLTALLFIVSGFFFFFLSRPSFPCFFLCCFILVKQNILFNTKLIYLPVFHFCEGAKAETTCLGLTTFFFWLLNWKNGLFTQKNGDCPNWIKSASQEAPPSFIPEKSV